MRQSIQQSLSLDAQIVELQEERPDDPNDKMLFQRKYIIFTFNFFYLLAAFFWWAGRFEPTTFT